MQETQPLTVGDDLDPPEANLGGLGGPEPDQPEPEPAAPTGRLQRPARTAEVYIVLMARKPARAAGRPQYVELRYVKAGNPEAAKRIVANADDKVGAFVRHSAAQKPGVLLRAVPAQSWPDTVEATGYEAPPPELVVR